MDIRALGWDPDTAVELDHRLLKAPHIKLRSVTEGARGDVVFCIDLRISQPNVDYMSQTELHSMEHFLLAGFRKYLPENFISVAPMGCQTGFYLILFNEGNAGLICLVYEKILMDILNAHEVPYASIAQCGNFQNHSLELAQKLAKHLLDAKANWRQVI